MVSLAPESSCAVAAGISELSSDLVSSGPGQSLANTASLGRLLLPCLDLINLVRLGADVRVSGRVSAVRRDVFTRSVSSALIKSFIAISKRYSAHAF
ncbi:unnamed protein product [Protopolystoma xenopodis]|uniref:Uncharacterized protein n=1 Tax=Protopolystoma xenopodis TaxID=117903 RepID=A0A448WU06_9PLAT|nr:unnamed protein product [Protopolystoma xenopodis]